MYPSVSGSGPSRFLTGGGDGGFFGGGVGRGGGDGGFFSAIFVPSVDKWIGNSPAAIFYLWVESAGAVECSRSSQVVGGLPLGLGGVPGGAAMVTVVVTLVVGVVVVAVLVGEVVRAVSFRSLGAPFDERLAPANTVIQQTPARKRIAPMAFSVAVDLAKAPPGSCS